MICRSCREISASARARAAPPRCSVLQGEGACGRNDSKHQTRAPAPWLGHFPCFSPSSPHNPSKCLPHWLSGKCDEFDQEKKHFSPSSIKFCECPERRWSLDSSRIYDCKQTVILLHNCPIALLWNILKFYGIEKVSIFKSSLNHKNREVTSRGKSEWLFLQDFWVIRLIFNLSCIWSII